MHLHSRVFVALAYIARVLCVCVIAMDNNFSWSVLVPLVLLTREPAGLLQGMGEKARDTEGSGRRVMTTRNTDGQVYTLDEFISHQMDQRSRPGARALEKEAEADQEEKKTYLAIKNALIRLLDEGEAPAPLMRRGFKHKKCKLPRTVLRWGRVVKKLLLFLHNDRTGRFACGSMSAIGE